jgi:hypothetical protein
MGTGDLFGDFRERRIRRAGIFESVFRHGDRVSAAMPFAHQPGTGLEAKPWIRSDPALGAKHLCQRLQLALCGPAETAMLKLLKAVADPAHQ